MLYESISKLKGVGAAREQGFKRLGIERIIDLVWHLPRRYEDRRILTPISKIRIGIPALISGRVVEIESKYIRPKLVLHKAFLEDETGSIRVNFFNQDYIVNKTAPGQKWVLYGAGEFFGKEKIFSMKEIDLRGTGVSLGMGTILPYYHATSATPQKYLRRLISEFIRALSKMKIDAPKYDVMPEFAEAARMVHLPLKMDEIELGRKRMALDELLMVRLCVERVRARKPKKKRAEKIRRIELDLPFRLTEPQKELSAEIENDLESDQPMRRLIEGDVGSGKTVLAVIAAVRTAERGMKTAFIAPTEILAEQHYNVWKGALEKCGVRAFLLTGSILGRDREEIYSAAVEDHAAVFFGTHALLSEKLSFKDLGLVVIDEQQRFGVVQRDALLNKGEIAGISPDILTLSATPIPRTLAMTLYGDLEISTLKELLPGRLPVKTFHFRETDRKKMMPFIKSALDRKESIFIVYPIIEEDEELNLRDAEGQYRKISAAFKNCKTALLTGRSKSEEKEITMKKFRDGKISILVATSVVEVGIDVPTATLMIVEHAEYFGLAQLHQLRGRVGRGGRPGTCILTTADILGEYAEERMKVLLECQDGFKIAEEDLRLRGPGEILGEHQHGGTELKVANLSVDFELIPNAQRLAKKLIEEDFELMNHNFLRRVIEGWEKRGADVF